MAKTPDYFAGKTIIITGAASGIGRATALIFACERANVVCADINEDSARDTAAKVNAAGSQAMALRTDVTSRAQVNDMVQRTVDAFGAVQFLFNSAGAAIRRAKFLEIDDTLMEKTFALNVNCHAGSAAAHAQEQTRRDRQYGEHGASVRGRRSITPRPRARWSR
jgi:NAD(P)-dependent dehydrogenase (short-subunit alcohol dehydrogenase family)